MKKLINKIGRLIVFIIITLMLYFRSFKYLILFRIHKINLHELKRYLGIAFYEYFGKAIIYGLMDANEAINSYKKAYEELIQI